MQTNTVGTYYPLILFIDVPYTRDFSFLAFFAASFNSFVHVVMYFYYMVSALGPQYRKYLWWKRYVTLLQIVSY